MTHRHDTGLTMVELMVAVAILAIVVAGVMQSFVVQNRAYTVVDQTTQVQQDLRTIASLIERDLRATGFLVPEGASACGVDYTDRPDILYVTDPDAFPQSNPADPFWAAPSIVSGMAVQPGDYTGATGLMTLNLATMTLDGQPSFDNDGDGVPDSDFRWDGAVGGGVILFDTTNPARGTACGRITGVGANSITVDFVSGLGVGVGSFAVVPAIEYRVDANGTLLRNGIALASDVEDLQVAYFIDKNDDGQYTAADPTEYPGAGGSPPYVSNAEDHSKLREVRFDVVVRSRTADPQYREGFFQATENRVAAVAADGFRRRVLTATVRPRNLGFRGAQG
jgi:prepilin-type N-terminal cleavage/methylation domain-containing protein